MLGPIIDVLRPYLAAPWGYVIVGVATFLENPVGAAEGIVPGEPLVIIGGFYARIGDLWLPAVAGGRSWGGARRQRRVLEQGHRLRRGWCGHLGVGHSVLGYALGACYQRREKYLTPAGLGILFVLLLLVVGSKLLAARRRVGEDITHLEAERSEDR